MHHILTSFGIESDSVVVSSCDSKFQSYFSLECTGAGLRQFRQLTCDSFCAEEVRNDCPKLEKERGTNCVSRYLFLLGIFFVVVFVAFKVSEAEALLTVIMVKCSV